MGNTGLARGWLPIAAIGLACAPVVGQAQTVAPSPKQRPTMDAAASPFGLSPETLAQAQRIMLRVRAAGQAAAQQIAAQLPKNQAAAPPPPSAPPQPKSPTPAGPQGPQDTPPNGVDWKLALADQRRSAEVGPRAVEGLSLDPTAVNRTSVPILLLRGAFIDGARIYSFGDYYSVTADMQGARISLTGTTARLALPPATRLAVTVGPEQLSVQRTVDGQLASFVRYGVLYTVELRCDMPDDGRCKTDAVVRDLVARNTVVVFGKAARQASGAGG